MATSSSRSQFLSRFAPQYFSSFVFAVALLFYSLPLNRAEDIENAVVGCGGFVQTSPELAKLLTQKPNAADLIDFSNIKIKLLTTDKLMKYSTECAPNGYYFIPSYDRGNYLLQVSGPSGWSFEPNEVAVHIGNDHRCQQQGHKVQGQNAEDINFQLSGFTISGNVVGENCDASSTSSSATTAAGKQTGFAGVNIQLIPAGSSANSKGVLSTVSDSKGHYSFPNVFPGQYTVQASHPTWTLSQSKAQVSMDWGNAVVATPFVVTGFDISGSVQSMGEAVLGVDFLLYSEQVQKIEGCSPVSADVASLAKDVKGKPLCSSVSDKNGEFIFRNVPCGKYTIVPLYRGGNTVFDVSPSKVSITVNQGSMRISEPFVVMGFSVGGKVVDSEGNGVPDVTIKVDGKEKTKSDANGNYKLDQLTVGSYFIEAEKEHLFFEPLKNFKVTPSMGSLPPIKVRSYHLCGRVHIPQSPKQRTITLISKTKEIAQKTTDKSGAFCFEVPAGQYQLKPEMDAKELAQGLLLSPSEYTATITRAPLLDVLFVQARVQVAGAVTCLDPKQCGDLTVTLTPVSADQSVKPVTVNVASGHFRFVEVIPGTYKLSVNKPQWCWAQSSIPVEVKTTDVSGLEFAQTGYGLSVTSTHAAKLRVIPDDDKTKPEEFTLAKGKNNFCLKNSGSYTLTPVSCHKFEQDSYKFDTRSSTNSLELIATHHLVKGTIQLSQLERLTDGQKPDLQVTVNRLGRANTVPQDKTPEVVETKKTDSANVYEYSLWARANEVLEIVPTSSNLLFYPQTRTVTVGLPGDGSGCPPSVEAIQARPGLYLTGTVTPPLDDFHITVTVQDTNEKIKEITSTPNGKYSVGPLYDNLKYRVSAARDEYVIEELPGGNFKAVKLGRITITVKDATSSAPLPGVLLSLSGGSYRSNNITHQNGTFIFSNLHPGQYYLRPVLKEYTFEPASKAITVTEGTDIPFTFSATRGAWSCFGVVKSLNGEPEKLVSVEAFGPEGEYEETQTDNNGNFRLRGLLPNRSYKVGVRQQGDDNRPIERSSPNSVTVQMKREDVHNVNFIVFRRLNKYDLTGTVETEPEWLHTLEVSVSSGDDSSKPLRTIRLGPSNYFDFGALPKGHYVVRLRSSLSPYIYSFNTPERPVDLQSASNLKLNFTASIHNHDQHDAGGNSLLGLLVVVLAIAGVFYHKSVIAFAQSVASGSLWKKPVVQDDSSSWLPPHLRNSNKGSPRGSPGLSRSKK